MSSLSYQAPSPSLAAPEHPFLRPLAAIRAFLKLLWIEIRRSQGYWLLPLMVGFSLSPFLTGNSWDDGVTIWPELNRWITQSYVLAGSLAAALAAWLADRDRRRRVAGLATTVPGGGFQRDLLAFATASFWGLIGYGLVFAWRGWEGVSKATWGGPNLPLIGTGALAILLFAAIGVVVGRSVPGKFTPLLALALSFGVTVFSESFNLGSGDDSFHHPFRLLLPWGLTSENDPDVFLAQDAPYETEMSVWLLGVLGIVLAGTALNRHRRPAGIIVMAVSVAVAGIGGWALVAKGEPWLGDNGGPPAFEWSCRQDSGVEVCVHPAYEALLDDTSEQVVAVVGPLAGLDGVPVRWQQSSPIVPETGISELWQMFPSTISWSVVESIFPAEGDGGPFSLPPDSQFMILNWLLERSGEPVESWPDGGPFSPRPASQLVILHWLLERSGGSVESWPMGWPEEVPHTEAQVGQGVYSPAEIDEAALATFEPEFRAAVDRFAALPAKEQRAWLEANWDALRAGELTLKDLP